MGDDVARQHEVPQENVRMSAPSGGGTFRFVCQGLSAERSQL